MQVKRNETSMAEFVSPDRGDYYCRCVAGFYIRAKQAVLIFIRHDLSVDLINDGR